MAQLDIKHDFTYVCFKINKVFPVFHSPNTLTAYTFGILNKSQSSLLWDVIYDNVPKENFVFLPYVRWLKCKYFI